jgi:heptosyltransferase-2
MLSDTVQHEADALLASCARGSHDGAPWILVNPHAHDMCPERRWPTDRFAELMDRLGSSQPDLHFGILGTEAERAVSEEARNGVSPAVRPRVHNLAGRTSLPALAGVLARARLLVTNDSGTMHLGAAVGTPLVALFGPESPLRYGPLAPPERCRVLQADVVCGPCLTYMNHKRAPCKGRNVCMEKLSVDDVMQACEEMLA